MGERGEGAGGAPDVTAGDAGRRGRGSAGRGTRKRGRDPWGRRGQLPTGAPLPRRGLSLLRLPEAAPRALGKAGRSQVASPGWGIPSSSWFCFSSLILQRQGEGVRRPAVWQGGPRGGWRRRVQVPRGPLRRREHLCRQRRRNLMIFRAAWSCFLVRKEPLVAEERMRRRGTPAPSPSAP